MIGADPASLPLSLAVLALGLLLIVWPVIIKRHRRLPPSRRR